MLVKKNRSIKKRVIKKDKLKKRKRVESLTCLSRRSTYERKKRGIKKPVEPVVDFYDGKKIRESESEKNECWLKKETTKGEVKNGLSI